MIFEHSKQVFIHVPVTGKPNLKIRNHLSKLAFEIYKCNLKIRNYLPNLVFEIHKRNLKIGNSLSKQVFERGNPKLIIRNSFSSQVFKIGHPKLNIGNLPSKQVFATDQLNLTGTVLCHHQYVSVGCVHRITLMNQPEIVFVNKANLRPNCEILK